MSSLKACMVLTTINNPQLLDGYYDNFKKFNHLEQVKTIIIPDLKTPRETYERVQSLQKKGMDIIYPTLEEQETYLQKVNFPANLIPYNSDNRRNVGYLMALDTEVNFLISIDDDNHCLPHEDFFEKHAIVSQYLNVHETVVSSNMASFYNVCDLLEVNNTVTYPRGLPYYARHKSNSFSFNQSLVNEVDINAGLWLIAPDIDGITWLVANPKVSKFKGESIILSQNVWSPINTQNTSLKQSAIPAYYFIKMGYPISGLPIDRYGDIFSGYFIEACAKAMNKNIRFGTPIANHIRNSHNYMKDASNEWACILILEDFLPWLTELKLKGKNYFETYLHLSHEIQEQVEKFKGKIWDDSTKGYFHQMAFHMKKWLLSCSVISKTSN